MICIECFIEISCVVFYGKCEEYKYGSAYSASRQHGKE